MAFSWEILRDALLAEKEADADPCLYVERVQYMFTGADAMCDAVMTALGLAEAAMPCACIVDAGERALYVDDSDVCTLQHLRRFIQAYAHRE